VRAVDQRGGPVGGAVVDHDQLPILEGLPLNTRDRGLDRLPTVVRRHDHGNEAHRRASAAEATRRSTIPSLGARVSSLADAPLLVAGSCLPVNRTSPASSRTVFADPVGLTSTTPA